MTYAMRPLGCAPPHVKGMSEKLIVSRYENNYGGAVKRLNLSHHRATLDFSSTPGFVVNGLKLRSSSPATRLILHEMFFDGLGEESIGLGTIAAWRSSAEA